VCCLGDVAACRMVNRVRMALIGIVPLWRRGKSPHKGGMCMMMSRWEGACDTEDCIKLVCTRLFYDGGAWLEHMSLLLHKTNNPTMVIRRHCVAGGMEGLLEKIEVQFAC